MAFHRTGLEVLTESRSMRAVPEPVAFARILRDSVSSAQLAPFTTDD